MIARPGFFGGTVERMSAAHRAACLPAIFRTQVDALHQKITPVKPEERVRCSHLGIDLISREHGVAPVNDRITGNELPLRAEMDNGIEVELWRNCKAMTLKAADVRWRSQ